MTMKLEIRPVEVRDLLWIRNLMWETLHAPHSSFIPEDDMAMFFEEQYSVAALAEMFRNRNVAGYVADVDGEVAGFTRTEFSEAEKTLCIFDLAVLPSYHGGGLGTRLLEIAESEARRRGLERVWLHVLGDVAAPLSWYFKLGFRFTEEKPVVMGKTAVQQCLGYRTIT